MDQMSDGFAFGFSKWYVHPDEFCPLNRAMGALEIAEIGEVANRTTAIFMEFTQVSIDALRPQYLDANRIVACRTDRHESGASRPNLSTFRPLARRRIIVAEMHTAFTRAIARGRTGFDRIREAQVACRG